MKVPGYMSSRSASMLRELPTLRVSKAVGVAGDIRPVRSGTAEPPVLTLLGISGGSYSVG